MLIRITLLLFRVLPVLALGLVPNPASAQAAPRALTLGKPTATSQNQFGLVNTIRELSNGSLWVADPLSGDLWLMDAALQGARKVGREGAGPQEFRQPDAVWPLKGDTTLLVDLGNGRLSFMDEKGTIVRSVPMIVGEFSPDRPLVSIMPRGTDERGRIYFQGAPMGPRGMADSVAVMRYDPATKKVDSIVTVKAPDFERSERGGAEAREVRIRGIPLAGGDGWAVGRNGALSVGRVGMYRVDWMDPNGKMRQGTPIPFDRVRVGPAEKKEWVTQQQLSGGVGMQVQNNNGEVSVSFSRNRGGGDGNTDGFKWPEFKPPFDNATLLIDPAGRLWVQRHLPAGRARQYDIISTDGKLAATLTLPSQRRVAGFGARGLYVVATDNDGLQTLERYAMPIQ